MHIPLVHIVDKEFQPLPLRFRLSDEEVAAEKRDQLLSSYRPRPIRIAFSVRLSVCLSARPSVCRSVCRSVCLSVCLSACLSVCARARVSAGSHRLAIFHSERSQHRVRHNMAMRQHQHYVLLLL